MDPLKSGSIFNLKPLQSLLPPLQQTNLRTSTTPFHGSNSNPILGRYSSPVINYPLLGSQTPYSTGHPSLPNDPNNILVKTVVKTRFERLYSLTPLSGALLSATKGYYPESQPSFSYQQQQHQAPPQPSTAVARKELEVKSYVATTTTATATAIPSTQPEPQQPVKEEEESLLPPPPSNSLPPLPPQLPKETKNPLDSITKKIDYGEHFLKDSPRVEGNSQQQQNLKPQPQAQTQVQEKQVHESLVISSSTSSLISGQTPLVTQPSQAFPMPYQPSYLISPSRPDNTYHLITAYPPPPPSHHLQALHAPVYPPYQMQPILIQSQPLSVPTQHFSPHYHQGIPSSPPYLSSPPHYLGSPVVDGSNLYQTVMEKVNQRQATTTTTKATTMFMNSTQQQQLPPHSPQPQLQPPPTHVTQPKVVLPPTIPTNSSTSTSSLKLKPSSSSSSSSSTKSKDDRPIDHPSPSENSNEENTSEEIKEIPRRRREIKTNPTTSTTSSLLLIGQQTTEIKPPVIAARKNLMANRSPMKEESRKNSTAPSNNSRMATKSSLLLFEEEKGEKEEEEEEEEGNEQMNRKLPPRPQPMNSASRGRIQRQQQQQQPFDSLLSIIDSDTSKTSSSSTIPPDSIHLVSDANETDEPQTITNRSRIPSRTRAQLQQSDSLVALMETQSTSSQNIRVRPISISKGSMATSSLVNLQSSDTNKPSAQIKAPDNPPLKNANRRIQEESSVIQEKVLKSSEKNASNGEDSLDQIKKSLKPSPFLSEEVEEDEYDSPVMTELQDSSSSRANQRSRKRAAEKQKETRNLKEKIQSFRNISQSLVKLSETQEENQKSETSSNTRPWQPAEQVILYQVFQSTDLNLPNFWELVSSKLQEKKIKRTPEECQQQWYHKLEVTDQRKRKNAEKKKETQIQATLEKAQSLNVKDRKPGEEEKPPKRQRMGKRNLQILAEQSSRADKEDDYFETFEYKRQQLRQSSNTGILSSPLLATITDVPQNSKKQNNLEVTSKNSKASNPDVKSSSMNLFQFTNSILASISGISSPPSGDQKKINDESDDEEPEEGQRKRRKISSTGLNNNNAQNTRGTGSSVFLSLSQQSTQELDEKLFENNHVQKINKNRIKPQVLATYPNKGSKSSTNNLKDKEISVLPQNSSSISRHQQAMAVKNQSLHFQKDMKKSLQKIEVLKEKISYEDDEEGESGSEEDDDDSDLMSVSE